MKSKRPTITMPPNLQDVKLMFTRRKTAKVIGKLAERDHPPKDGDEVSGILVTQNFNSKIVSPEELSTYSQLRVGSVKSTLHVPFVGKIDTLRMFFNDMFSGMIETPIESDEDKEVVSFSFHDDQVCLKLHSYLYRLSKGKLFIPSRCL